MRFPLRFSLLSLLLLLLLAASPSPRIAPSGPDVTYTTASVYHLSGLVGRVLSRSLPDVIYEHAYLSGNVMLTKNEEAETGTLINLGTETFTHLNYKEQTYSTITFDELQALYQQRLEEATQQQGEPVEDGEERPTTDVQFQVTVDRTGEIITYNDMACERVVITIQATGTATDEETQETAGGQLVIVTDALITNEVPGYAKVRAFNQELAEKMGRALTAGNAQEETLSAIAKALGNDETGLKASLDEAQAKLKDLDGMAVKTIFHMVSVPYGMTYNPDLLADSGETATEEQPKKKRRGLRGLRNLVEEAATGASSSNQQAQNTVFKIESTVNNAQETTLAAGTVGIPSGFEEVAFTM